MSLNSIQANELWLWYCRVAILLIDQYTHTVYKCTAAEMFAVYKTSKDLEVSVLGM